MSYDKVTDADFLRLSHAAGTVVTVIFGNGVGSDTTQYMLGKPAGFLSLTIDQTSGVSVTKINGKILRTPLPLTNTANMDESFATKDLRVSSMELAFSDACTMTIYCEG